MMLFCYRYSIVVIPNICDCYSDDISNLLHSLFHSDVVTFLVQATISYIDTFLLLLLLLMPDLQLLLYCLVAPPLPGYSTFVLFIGCYSVVGYIC